MSLRESDTEKNINCLKNPNNPLCKGTNINNYNLNQVGNDAKIVLYIIIITYVIFIALTIFAVTKTKNEGIKIFLIVGLFIPFISPITFIISLLIIFGVLK